MPSGRVLWRYVTWRVVGASIANKAFSSMQILPRWIITITVIIILIVTAVRRRVIGKLLHHIRGMCLRLVLHTHTYIMYCIIFLYRNRVTRYRGLEVTAAPLPVTCSGLPDHDRPRCVGPVVKYKIYKLIIKIIRRGRFLFLI